MGFAFDFQQQMFTLQFAQYVLIGLMVSLGQRQQFSLFGRAVQKYSLTELREIESDLVGRVADRKAAAAGGNPSIGRPVLATFNKAAFDQ